MNAVQSITANTDQTSTTEARTYRRQPTHREWGVSMLDVLYRQATEYSPHILVSILPDRELAHPDIWWRPEYNDGERPPHVRRKKAFRYPLGAEPVLLAVGHPGVASSKLRPHLYLAASLVFDLAATNWREGLEESVELMLEISHLIMRLARDYGADMDAGKEAPPVE